MNKKHWPNFNESMSYSYSYTHQKTDFDKWELIEQRYNVIKERNLTTQKIPKKIHQIWIGNSIPKNIYNNCINLKKSLPPDWEYKFWTLQDLPFLKEFKQIDNFYKTPNPGQKSDLLRLHILYEYGGIYCDTDFVLFKSFEELLDLDFFSGIVYDPIPNTANSILGSSPKNNLISDLQELDGPIDYSNGMAIINATGQGLITKKVFKHINEMENIVVLPNSFLYPFPNCPTLRIAGNDFKKYIKPETFACHLWDCSWM